ncbi:MAG: MotA/TolQ/ExbB proton channel family protein [bacterium]|nr:hypothetical protein [Gammaproteobacteria bacterium]HIL98130.1 hypothetical protein [Pseudomonadales bacterium]
MRNSGPLAEHRLLLRALILTSLILFGFFLLGERGYLTLTLESDRSQISYIILSMYALLSIHWLYLVFDLSHAQKLIDRAQPLLEEANTDSLTLEDNQVCIDKKALADGLFSEYLRDLLKKSNNAQNGHFEHSILLEALGERLMAKHSFGHYASDVLLKLGLLGTIIGFIMMLTPVGELTDFDPNVLQQLLGQMSGGMAVALFTTLAGLVTSTLLGLQYQLLDVASVRFVDRVATCVEVLVVPLLTQETEAP